MGGGGGFPHFWVGLRAEVSIYEALHGFMPRESATDAPFALRLLIGTYRRDVVEGCESWPMEDRRSEQVETRMKGKVTDGGQTSSVVWFRRWRWQKVLRSSLGVTGEKMNTRAVRSTGTHITVSLSSACCRGN